jgi:hypothetical protein
MMVRAINCAAALLLLSGCGYVHRKADVYREEVLFLRDVSLESANTLHGVLNRFCVCTNGQWSDPVCAEAEVNAAILEQRVPYHTGMMLYLADLDDVEPSDPKDDLFMRCGGDE